MVQSFVEMFGTNLRRLVAAVVHQSITAGLADGLQSAKQDLQLQFQPQTTAPVTLDPLVIDAPSVMVHRETAAIASPETRRRAARAR